MPCCRRDSRIIPSRPHQDPAHPRCRIAFNRKNKTLRATFTTDTVLEMLQNNMKTVASLKNTPLPADFDLKQVKAAVEEVLTSLGISDKRASKMDIDDFLQLLAEMNKAGIHFHA